MKEDRDSSHACDEQALDDIAHDLNNLLTVIRSRAQLVLECEQVSAEAAESLDHILIASNRAVTLIDQLRAVRCPS